MKPSTPNFEAAYAVKKSPVDAIPAVDEIVTTSPDRWARSWGIRRAQTARQPPRRRTFAHPCAPPAPECSIVMSPSTLQIGHSH